MRTSTVVALAIVCQVTAVAAQETREQDGRNRAFLALLATVWPGINDLRPLPVDAIAESSGSFKTLGFGIAMGGRRRVGPPSSGWFLGGEFAVGAHDNESAYVWRNALTGERSTIRLMATWGHVTASSHYIWRQSRTPEIALGAAGGLYMMRIQEIVEGLGTADRHESDTAPGGYVNASLNFPIGRRVRIVVDVRRHVVRFRNIGPTFAGQEIGRSPTTLALGLELALKK